MAAGMADIAFLDDVVVEATQSRGGGAARHSARASPVIPLEIPADASVRAG